MQTLLRTDRTAFLEASTDLADIDGLRRSLDALERLDPDEGMVVVNMYGAGADRHGLLDDAFWDFLDVVVHLQSRGPEVIFTEPEPAAIRQLVARGYLPSSALIAHDPSSALCASTPLRPQTELACARRRD